MGAHTLSKGLEKMELILVEVGLAMAIATVGFLLKRAIQSLDVTLQEIVQTIHGTSHGDNGLKSRVMVLEEKSTDHEQQSLRFSDLLENLRLQLQAEAIKNAENFGEVKTDIREVLATLREIRNRRDDQ